VIKSKWERMKICYKSLWKLKHVFRLKIKLWKFHILTLSRYKKNLNIIGLSWQYVSKTPFVRRRRMRKENHSLTAPCHIIWAMCAMFDKRHSHHYFLSFFSLLSLSLFSQFHIQLMCRRKSSRNLELKILTLLCRLTQFFSRAVAFFLSFSFLNKTIEKKMFSELWGDNLNLFIVVSRSYCAIHSHNKVTCKMFICLIHSYVYSYSTL
jgi:hypothetical protein